MPGGRKLHRGRHVRRFRAPARPRARRTCKRPCPRRNAIAESFPLLTSSCAAACYQESCVSHKYIACLGLPHHARGRSDASTPTTLFRFRDGCDFPANARRHTKSRSNFRFHAVPPRGRGRPSRRGPRGWVRRVLVAQPMQTGSFRASTSSGTVLGPGEPHEGYAMNPRHYIDLKENHRDLQPTYYFMINCLLYSRMETGLVSNQDFYDEDVNVYLAHLLHSFINPEYVEQSKKFLSKYDTDVFRRLSTSTDARLKYQIYKTNADFMLVSIGIFDNPTIAGAARSRLQPSEEAYIGRGKTYYHFAYTYSQQVHRKNAGVSDVLEKLSNGFEKYLRILSHMRGEYLDLMSRFSQGEVYHLERSVDEHAQQELLRTKQDELLELYTAWRDKPDTATEENLERVLGEIRAINPGFKFELPRR